MSSEPDAHRGEPDTEGGGGADPGVSGPRHLHQPSTVTRRAVRLTLAALVPAAVLTVVGLFVLWPDAAKREPWTGPDTVPGEVVAVNERPCPETEPQLPGGEA